MKFNCLFVFSFSFVLMQWNPTFAQKNKNGANQAEFYMALFDDEIELIDDQLGSMSQFPAKDTLAYEGALLMKKAGLLILPTSKLSSFKEGRNKLEAAIAKDSSNAEFRFLRLIMQENAPSFMRYSHNIENDKLLIQQKYFQLSPFLKGEIRKYTLHSSVLSISDFEH